MSAEYTSPHLEGWYKASHIGGPAEDKDGSDSREEGPKMGISRQAKPGHAIALSIPLIAIVAVALVLGWGHASGQSAHADGPRMALNAGGTGVSCDDPSEPTECTVPLAGFFTLSVAAVEPPAGGYIGFQTFIDYGRDFYDPDRAEDDFAPPICGDARDNGNDGFRDIDDADCIDQPLT